MVVHAHVAQYLVPAREGAVEVHRDRLGDALLAGPRRRMLGQRRAGLGRVDRDRAHHHRHRLHGAGTGPAGAHRGAGTRRQVGVAGRVDNNLRLQPAEPALAANQHALDAAVARFGIDKRRVVEDDDALARQHRRGLHAEQVGVDRGHRVHVSLGERNVADGPALLDQAVDDFLCQAVDDLAAVLRLVGVDAQARGGVAADEGPRLDQNGACTLAGGGDGRADAGDAAAGDQHVEGAFNQDSRIQHVCRLIRGEGVTEVSSTEPTNTIDQN